MLPAFRKRCGAQPTGHSMLIRLLIISAVVAAFAAGFSELVSHTDQTMRPQRASLACQDWTGQNCSQPVRR